MEVSGFCSDRDGYNLGGGGWTYTIFLALFKKNNFLNYIFELNLKVNIYLKCENQSLQVNNFKKLENNTNIKKWGKCKKKFFVNLLIHLHTIVFYIFWLYTH